MTNWKGVGKESVMRQRLFLLASIILLAGIPVLADPIYENPTLYGIEYSDHSPVFPIVVLIALTVEFFAIGFAVGRKLTLWQLLLSFVTIHIIVFPMVTLASAFVGYPAEALALILEPLLFIRAATIFHAQVPYLCVIVVGANTLSFVVGLVLFPLLHGYFN